MKTETKGTRLINGIDKLREGLDLINQLGDGQDLMRLLISSPSAAKRLKEMLKDDNLLHTLIVSMVASRNSRLTPATVEKIVEDFLDVVFDLSQPIAEPEKEGADES